MKAANEGNKPVVAVSVSEQPRHEWEQQIGKVHDQPKEVLQNALAGLYMRKLNLILKSFSIGKHTHFGMRHDSAVVLHPPCSYIQPCAWVIFQKVFHATGSVTGSKARALVLVSLLYASGLLHGSNGANEEYLLKTLHTPTRIMNKAFTQMASVTLPKSIISAGAAPRIPM
jgi:hypothetical protein